MSRKDDPAYFAARLSVEREAIKAAKCLRARASHVEMAAEYEQRLAKFAADNKVSDAESGTLAAEA